MPTSIRLRLQFLMPLTELRVYEKNKKETVVESVSVDEYDDLIIFEVAEELLQNRQEIETVADSIKSTIGKPVVMVGDITQVKVYAISPREIEG